MAATARPLVAGNWKMHGTRASMQALVGDLLGRLGRDAPPVCEMLICPPAPYLAEAAAMLSGCRALALGAQDCHPAERGAHTGDIAAPMLREVGCSYVIVGHSERRGGHGEGDDLVRAKAEAALAAGLRPIVCIGETSEDRDAGRVERVIAGQLGGSLPATARGADTVIAYEPVWAIGSGRTPAESEIAAVHAQIRGILRRRDDDADAFRILYGGSVKPDNARAILGAAEVNGVLVGGASLDAGGFWSICRAWS